MGRRIETFKPKYVRFILTASIMAILCIAATESQIQAQSLSDWPMYGHDLAHTNYSTSAASANLERKWNYTFPSGIAESSPAVSGGYLYIGAGVDTVYCLDAYTGVQVWNYTFDDFILSSPSVAEGYVYIGSQDSNLYCLDALSGAKKWNVTLTDYVASPAVTNGRIYVGTGSSIYDAFFCLDADTGATIWAVPIGPITSSPAVADGYVYVGSHDGYVHCFDADTGAEEWSFWTYAHPALTPTVANGRVYAGGAAFFCIDASSGAQIWNFTTSFGGASSAPAIKGNNVYVSCTDRNLYCLDATTGSEKWHFKTEASSGCSPALAGNYAYIGDEGGNVYCINAETGVEEWSARDGRLDILETSPAVANGYVYFGTEYIVIAYGPYTGATITPSPSIPEFPEQVLSIALFISMTVMVVAAIMYKKKNMKHRSTP